MPPRTQQCLRGESSVAVDELAVAGKRSSRACECLRQRMIGRGYEASRGMFPQRGKRAGGPCRDDGADLTFEPQKLLAHPRLILAR